MVISYQKQGNSKNSRNIGLALSYINIALTMLMSIIITPVMINAFTSSEYSIYKVIQSFVGPLIILNFGVSALVSRNIAECNTLGTKADVKRKNTQAFALIISFIMILIIMFIGAAMYTSIGELFSNTFTSSDILTGKKLFLIFLTSICINVINQSFIGNVIGNEKFIFFYGISTIKITLRIVLVIVLLRNGDKSIMIALLDLILVAFMFLTNVLYSAIILNERPKFYYFDKIEIKKMLIFSFAIFLQGIIVQINNSVDNVILGALVSNKNVLISYSSALVIYAAYNGLVSTVSTIYTPVATRMVISGASGTELTNLIIKPGRFQATIAFGIIAAFILFGRNFIVLWIGSEYISAWVIALILMVPMTIPLIQNVCLSILDAKMMRMFRSIVLAIVMILNIIISIYLVRRIGYIGAAISTASSIFIGEIIIMNRYYFKKIGLDIVRMYKEIFKGILRSAIITTVLCLPLVFLFPNDFYWFVLKCLIFCICYAILLWRLGLNKDEKIEISNILRKLLKK